MGEHTPLPWFLKLSDNATPHIMHRKGRDLTDIDDLSSRVCVMPAEITTNYNSLANAAFIVTACNTHHELVEALEDAIKSLQFYADQFGFFVNTNCTQEDINNKRALVSRAKGETNG